MAAMISRLYEGSPGMRMLASSQVSYSLLMSGMPLVFRKLVSNWMLWPMMG